MKKSIYFGAMLALSMCVSGASAQQSGTMSSGDKMQMSAKKNPDSKFMMMAAMSDMAEIGMSNLALTKSTNEEVKKYAQMMIDDHTKASDELKMLAANKNVTLPMSVDAKHKAGMDKLSAMSGEMFDKEFLKMMLKDHEKAVAMFQKESTSGKDPEAKAFASSTLPTLQGHLEMARTMNGKMSGKMMKGDGKMSGM